MLTLVLAVAATSNSAWAATYVVNNPNKNNSFTLMAGDVLTINSNVNFGGTITVAGSGVVITNNGDISTNGTITVNNGVTGTVINNLGTVPSQNIYLNAETTINNGSATVSAGVSWSGYVGNKFAVAPTINNYASWTAQIQPLPGGTIENKSGATWNAYLTTSANLTVVNAGTWSSQIQEAANSPTISITQNGGSWTGTIGGGSGSLRVTNNAAWTVGFNFPSGGANAFTTAAGATSVFAGYLGLSGTVVLVNNGTMTLNAGMAPIGTESSLTNGSGAVFSLTGDFTNLGTVANLGTLAATANFTNAGVITGPSAQPRARITAGVFTSNSGSFGADGSYLDFCDATPPTPASKGFDSRNGTVGANVTFCAPVSAGPLPVELTSFTAQGAKGKVQLRWSTASEHNSAKFVVERSANGQAFSAVAEVEAQGNSSQARTYAVVDAKPLPGKSYYRLRQVDRDGAVAFSPVATASTEATYLPIELHPNPATDRLTLDLSSLASAPCDVRLVGLTGQVWLSTSLAGGQAQELPLHGVPSGLYLLQVRTAQGTTVQRIEKR